MIFDAWVVPSLAVMFAVLPTALTLLSRRHVIQRRKEMLVQDLRQKSESPPPALTEYVASRGGIDILLKQVEDHLSDGLGMASLSFGALNAAGLLLSWEYSRDASTHAGYLPMVYAFIGTYLFNFGVLVGRLASMDLNAHLLWRSVNRLMLATMLSQVIPSVPQMSPATFYFAMGFLSSLFLEALLERVLKVAGIRRWGRDGLSLRMIRGIDMWKEDRLAEEGITSVQHLATQDAIDLAVKTHYNLLTLVDWIDQAIVILRLQEKVKKLEAKGFNISAVDLAWASPAHSSSGEVANTIASELGVPPAAVIALMNGLLEDQLVKNLWILWQTREGYKAPRATPPAEVSTH